ncbi:MAG: hypothetical protein LVQ64_06145, partial [Thermoplasmatales archaeon]|nr:hypothetical protein [Thermoplasmatales archaeon]
MDPPTGDQPVPGGEGASAAPFSALPTPRSIAWRAWLGSPIALLPLALVAAIVIVLLYASELKNFGWSFWSFNYLFDPLTDSGSFGVGIFAAGS